MSTAELLSRLEDILEAIAEIEAFLGDASSCLVVSSMKTFDDYMAEPLLRRGVERDIEIISEASRHIPRSFKTRYPLIPWRKVAGIGNICATATRTSTTMRCGTSRAPIWRRSRPRSNA